MRYLLDTNSLSNEIIKLAGKSDDFFIINDILDELPHTEEEQRRIKSSGMNIVSLAAKHFEKLKEVLGKYGDDFQLIRISTQEGTADVLMLAYILGERDAASNQLFAEAWIIVTKDNELARVAQAYRINSISDTELLKQFKS